MMKINNFKSLLYWIFQAFVITGLVWYLKKIDFDSIKLKIISVELISFIVGLFLIIFVNLFRPIRSWMMLKSLGVLIKWWQLFRWNQEALFLALLTPGKVGEFYKAYLIEKEYEIKGAGIFITIFERWIDAVLVLLIGLFVLILQPTELIGTLRNITVAILMIIISISFALVLSKKIRWFLRKCLSIIPNGYIQNKLNYITLGLSRFCRSSDYFSILTFIIASIFIWIIYIFGFCIILDSLKINLNIFQIISCTVLVLFVQSIPVTFLGFGTREATLIFYFKNYGLNSSDALSVSFLFVLVSLLYLLISGSFWIVQVKNNLFYQRGKNIIKCGIE